MTIPGRIRVKTPRAEPKKTKIWSIEPFGLKTDAVARMDEISKHLDASIRILDRNVLVEGMHVPVYFLVVKVEAK